MEGDEGDAPVEGRGFFFSMEGDVVVEGVDPIAVATVGCGSDGVREVILEGGTDTFFSTKDAVDTFFSMEGGREEEVEGEEVTPFEMPAMARLWIEFHQRSICSTVSS